MKISLIAALFLASIARTLAQPTPPASGTVMANSSTGALVTPTNFFTNATNAAAIGASAPVKSVAGRTGNVTLAASDLINGNTGTGNVVLSVSPTLISPIISTIVNVGNLTLPTTTDTLLGRATTDTVTNKTISGASNTLTNIPNSALANASISIAGASTALGGSITLDTIDNGLSANGFIARTAANTRAARTITGTANQITVGNGTGFAGDPTLSLPASLILLANSTAVNFDSITATAGADATITGGSSGVKLRLSQGTPGNATLSSKYVIAAMGDSLTSAGVYEARLMSDIGASWYCENRGVSGNTTALMLARFGDQVASRNNINYVVIWGGVNDCIGLVPAGTIEANLQSMYTAAHSAGIKVIAVNITPFKNSVGWTAPIQAVADAVNTWISSSATNIDYKIDAFSLLVDPVTPNTLLPAYDDGSHLHLTSLGYNVVADAINSAVSPWAHTVPPSTSIQIGSNAPNVIYDAGAANLSTDAQWIFGSSNNSTGRGTGSVVIMGGASVEKTLTVGDSVNAGTLYSGSSIGGATLSLTSTQSADTSALGAAVIGDGTSGGTVGIGGGLVNAGNAVVSPRIFSNFTLNSSYVGGSYAGVPLIVSAAHNTNFTSAPVILSAYDLTTMAAGVGGGLIMGGQYTSGGGYTEFGYVGAVKSNSTSGDYSGILRLGARKTGTGAGDMTIVTLDGATQLTTLAGNLTVSGTGTSSFAGAVSIGTAGNTISVKSGANAAAGTVTLVAGTATITSTAIDANTVIIFSEKTAGGTPGLYQPLAAVSAGNATVTSAVTDTSTYNWVALKVAP